MNTPTLPAVRLATDSEYITADGVTMDVPATKKFSVAYAPMDPRQLPSLAVTSGQERNGPNPPDGQVHGLDGDTSDETEFVSTARDVQALASPPGAALSSRRGETSDMLRPATYISRTRSMPLPSQLSQLENPHRPQLSSSFSSPIVPLAQSAHVSEISKELGDSLQMVIQTMLQISPPQVLDPAKEQFSACSLSVPTSSMSAMFTAMKNLNYISANMAAFCEMGNMRAGESSTFSASRAWANTNEFDLGEMAQCVGDALSGLMAQSGVDSVLYHGDVGLRQVYVQGDESGISFALSHIVRQVLKIAERGDSIEIGVLVTPAPEETPQALAFDDIIQVAFRISHAYSVLPSDFATNQPRDVVTTEHRSKPDFSALFLQQIVKQIKGTLVSDLPPPESFTIGYSCELRVQLKRVPPPNPTPSTHESQDIEPSFQRLATFGETLKGKRVNFYANNKGPFAHRLTAYLTTLGMDVQHVSSDGKGEYVADPPPYTPVPPRTPMNSNLSSYFDGASGSSGNTRLSPGSRNSGQESANLILIDDDIDILKERLSALRWDHFPFAKRRPQLSSRSKSSPQVARLLGLSGAQRLTTPFVIVHFTSLSNYKPLKDVIQNILTSYAGTATPLPEIMIIPKPAGPRRIMTAIYTAITKPTVDSFFVPIATSPMSPGIQNVSSYITSPPNEYPPASTTATKDTATTTTSTTIHSTPAAPVVKNGGRPHGSRSNSDKSVRSVEATPTIPHAVPSSPLATPSTVEYFSTLSGKLETYPPTGLLIQSPDGQPAGIVFEPRSRSNSQKTGISRKNSTARIPLHLKKEDALSFSMLHEATQTSEPLPISPALAASRLASLSSAPLESSPLAPMPASRRPSDENRSSIARNSSPTLSRRSGRRPMLGSEAPAKPARKPGTPADVTIVPPISVLIVDDNPINQTILSAFMRKKNIPYDLANNGQEAVEKWRTGKFHLILMDIQMPVMDGIQATKEIRRLEKVNAAAALSAMTPSFEEPPPSEASVSSSESRAPGLPSVIILALTASSLQSDRVAALAAGCNDFLTKPVSLLWLNNKIIEWGSIKALQMWADIRPDAATTIATGQAAQARNIADRLHVPLKAQDRGTPSPSRRRADDNAAVLALAMVPSVDAVPKRGSFVNTSSPDPDRLKSPTRGSSFDTPTAPSDAMIIGTLGRKRASAIERPEPTRTSSQAEETQEDKTIAPQPHPSGSEGSPQRLNGGCSRDARAISPSDGFRTTPPFNHP